MGGCFWSKVLRKLLEPFAGIKRDRPRCECRGYRKNKFKKKCRMCGGTGSLDTKTTRVASILNRFRDETVAIIMCWFDGLSDGHKHQLVTTLFNNINLGWFEAIPGAGWVKAAGVSGAANLIYIKKLRKMLKDWINGHINSQIEKYVAILVEQVEILHFKIDGVRYDFT